MPGIKIKTTVVTVVHCCVGIALSSRAASSQVLSALMSLATVFGMGTGGPSSLKTPTNECLFNAFVSFNVGYYITSVFICQYLFATFFIFFEKVFLTPQSDRRSVQLPLEGELDRLRWKSLYSAFTSYTFSPYSYIQ